MICDFKSSIDIHNEFDFWLAETVYKEYVKKDKTKKSSSFLGNDLKSWSQSIRNGYIRSFIIFALHETGVFNLMRENKELTIDLLKKVNRFAEIFWTSKNVKTYKAICPYPPAQELIYPDLKE